MTIEINPAIKVNVDLSKVNNPLSRPCSNAMGIHGVWKVDHYRGGELIAHTESHNHITTEGIKRLFDVFFGGNGANNTQTATWYVGLFESDTTCDGTETYDVPVFTECTSYDEGVRRTYTEAATTEGGVVTNTATKAIFTISATKTVYGAFLASVNTKGDHTGGANNVLFAAEKFGTARAVVDNDVLNVTYEITGADA